ncbi:hypothetical protein J4221_04625 [Candidatus Pacearchaeota archaeon]|nr:hypothetical protein [Candidatus Pacearchaeota archaeon]
MKFSDIINILMKIVFIILVIFIIYGLIKLLFGGSPTLSQINAAFIAALMTIMFSLIKSYSDLNREVGEIKIGMKNGFNKVKEDFEKLTEYIKEIKDIIKKGKL